MKFTASIFVRWADLDAFGHVNNATYLTYAEVARVAWSRHKFAEKKPNSALVQMTVARSEIDYLLPITQFGVNYDMHLWVEKVGNSSYTCAYELVKDDVIYAKMKTVPVMIDIEKMKSRPLAEDERAFLNSYLLP